MFPSLICIVAAMVGHMVRDGWPPWRESLDAIGRARWPAWLQTISNPTQLARISGAIICGLGALAVHPPVIAAMIGMAVLIGFYTDMKHGEGQGPDDTWKDTGHNLPFLFISGVTSLVPLGLLAHLLAWALWPPVMLWSLLKPPIWVGSWLLGPDRWWPWLVPTRLAAMLFGTVVGVIIAFAV